MFRDSISWTQSLMTLFKVRYYVYALYNLSQTEENSAVNFYWENFTFNSFKFEWGRSWNHN